MVQQKISHRASFITIEKLRSIAILFYKLHVLDLEKSLWNHYLKASTGLFMGSEGHLKLCPKDIQTKLELAPLLKRKNDSSNQMQKNNKYYVRFIREHLHKFNQK
ncbi:unnamed protein product [Adineta steineri]|nr:unnamed protein product [Adineta steineri]